MTLPSQSSMRERRFSSASAAPLPPPSVPYPQSYSSSHGGNARRDYHPAPSSYHHPHLGGRQERPPRNPQDCASVEEWMRSEDRLLFPDQLKTIQLRESADLPPEKASSVNQTHEEYVREHQSRFMLRFFFQHHRDPWYFGTDVSDFCVGSWIGWMILLRPPFPMTHLVRSGSSLTVPRSGLFREQSRR